MDENNEGAEIARRVAREWVREGNEGSELIPLSVVAIDHPEPLAGWEPLLEAHGIELLTDDLYRPAIRREDARQLVEERREWERSSAEKANRLQEELEAPPVGGGVPALEDAGPFESLMAGDPSHVTPAEEFGGRPKPNFLAEELEAGARHLAAARAEAESKKAARDG